MEQLVEQLPGTRLGEAHEGSPAYYAGRHQFARLRRDEAGRELVQLWSGDMDSEAQLAGGRDVFPVVHSFRYRVSMWGYLDRLDRRELAELLLDSYAIRGGTRRRAAVDLAAYLPD